MIECIVSFAVQANQVDFDRQTVRGRKQGNGGTQRRGQRAWGTTESRSGGATRAALSYS